MVKHKVLSTKKLDPSLMDQAKQNGIDIIEQEFISIRPIWNQQTSDAIQHLLNERKITTIAFTSANAVDVLNRYMQADDALHVVNWNIFCLSGKTRQAIVNAGHLGKNIAGESTSASALAEKIIQAGIRELIFFCGSQRRDELPDRLKRAAINVHEIVLYETVQTPAISSADFDAVLFFSPSAVHSFFSSNEPNDKTVCFAIGPTTAASISTFTRNRIIASIAPDQNELIKEVIEYFKQNSAVS